MIYEATDGSKWKVGEVEPNEWFWGHEALAGLEDKRLGRSPSKAAALADIEEFIKKDKGGYFHE